MQSKHLDSEENGWYSILLTMKTGTHYLWPYQREELIHHFISPGGEGYGSAVEGTQEIFRWCTKRKLPPCKPLTEGRDLLRYDLQQEMQLFFQRCATSIKKNVFQHRCHPTNITQWPLHSTPSLTAQDLHMASQNFNSDLSSRDQQMCRGGEQTLLTSIKMVSSGEVFEAANPLTASHLREIHICTDL